MIVILTQCFPPTLGGIENFMGGLADSLAANGEEITVFADPLRKGEQEIAKPYSLRRFGGPRFWRRWRKRQALLGLFSRVQISHVIADSYKSLQQLPPLNAKIITFAHGTEYPPHASPAKQTRIREALAHATHIIANSRYTSGLVQPYVSGGTQLHAIPSPIFPQAEPSLVAQAWLAQIIVNASPRILTLCRLEPRKGIDQVIRAMPAIRHHFPDAHYLVAGGGEDAARLKQLAADLGVANAVSFTGRVDADQKAALYASADVFAMPTRREGNSVEGFGLTYIEAGWYGGPSLAGSEGGAADAVLDGQTGLLCDGANATDVQENLLQLLTDTTLRNRMGDAAKTRAREELQWGPMITRYKALGIL